LLSQEWGLGVVQAALTACTTPIAHLLIGLGRMQIMAFGFLRKAM